MVNQRFVDPDKLKHPRSASTPYWTTDLPINGRPAVSIANGGAPKVPNWHRFPGGFWFKFRPRSQIRCLLSRSLARLAPRALPYSKLFSPTENTPPRAVTRKVDSDASKALAAKGVEVVAADLFDKESLKKAVRGSEAVFGVTNFWDPSVFPADETGKGEITQGKNLVDAAKEVGVKFFIWSSLPNVAKESNGLYKHVYHYDNKAAIDEYLKASGVPYAVLQTFWFGENLWKLGSLTKTDTGYIIPVPKYGPDDIQSATWVGKDLGPSAVALLKNYTDGSKGVVGKVYPVVSLRFTYTELAAAIAIAIKKEVKFVPVETAGNAEIDEMFLFQAKVPVKTPSPNPDLVALGVKFASLSDFVQKEIVPRFA
ncbi:NmrA domain-containing protein [Mycena venus]|uniref:NmrA domain-containing protein n=1 Tax=Mycena venus TaxID=2733690 RepID=A0A8H6YGH5_9AGAR|nr:NmrA domain-containing protein [Mycena venus]